jgi:hypothetical protein
MKFNFRKIASTAASIALAGSTIALAAASTFPEPFVDNGVGDVAVVYGSSLDLGAVTDITGTLNGAISSGGSTGTPTGGDFVQLKRSSDNLNMGNSWSVFGTTVDDDDLPDLLADGVYSNDENNDYDYTQKITFATGEPANLSFFEDSDYNSKENAVGFHLSSNVFVFNYTLDFTEQPQSDVVSGDLDDIESTSLSMLGREYFIFDADNSTLDLTLLDSANSAIVSEGETITLDAGGISYDVSIEFVSTSEVILNVNGETTNSLNEKETQKISDGSFIGIKDILARDVAGAVSKVEFSIGSGKLFLDNGANIELNDDDVDELKVYITRGSFTSSKETLDQIVIEWTTDEEEFLTSESDLILPGFESVKFSMNDFVTESEEVVSIQHDADDEFEIQAPIEDGDATFNFLAANSSGEFIGIGGSVSSGVVSERLATSASNSILFNVSSSSNNRDEWFVLSWNTSSDSESYLLKINSGDIEDDNGVNKTTIRNVVTGDIECSKKDVADTCDIGNAQLTMTAINRGGSERSVTLTAGTDTTFHNLFTKDGLHIQLPYLGANNSASPGLINLTNTHTSTTGHNSYSYYMFLREEDKDDDVAEGTSFNLTLDDNSDGDLQVSEVNNAGTGGPTGLEVANTNTYETMIVSDLATRISHFTDADEDSVEITYWGSEAYAEVFIADIGTSSEEGEAGNLKVLDSDLASSGMQNKNLVIVGGTCVNSAAATVLGLSSPTCGDAWEAATGVGSGSWLIQTEANPWASSKLATVVAGYSQGDTVNAAEALTSVDTIDIDAGMAYTGTTGSAATPVIS